MMIPGSGSDESSFEFVSPFRRLFDGRFGGGKFQEGEYEIVYDDTLPPEADGEEFDTIYVRITQPMDYVITQELLDLFVHRNAFAFKDGSEAELGPISVKHVHFVDHDKPLVEAAAGIEAKWETWERNPPMQEESFDLLSACGVVAGILAVAGALVVFRRRAADTFFVFTRRYELLESELCLVA